MGNKQSLFCVLRTCCCSEDDIRIVEAYRRSKKRSVHSKTPVKPQTSSASSAGNGRSAVNISDPETQLNVDDDEKAKIKNEIGKEQKLKEGAEKILKVVSNEQHLAHVQDFLAKSNTKLEELYKHLQDLNSRSDAQQVEDLPVEAMPNAPEMDIEIATTSVPETDVENTELPPLPGAQISVLDIVHPVDVTSKEPNVSITANVVQPDEEIPNELEEPMGKELGLPIEEKSEASEVSIMENVIHPVDEKAEEPHLSITENVVLRVEEKINELEGHVEENIDLQVLHCVQCQPPMSLQDFRLCAVLGYGTFGKVLLAEYRKTNKMVAIKNMKKAPYVAIRRVHRLTCEKRILETASSARHPFLINLFASFQSRDEAFFAMEYAAGGDLWVNLKNSAGVFNEPRSAFYAACVVLGLEFLHGKHIAHRDLKLGNVVLDGEGFAKITDFGLCKEGMGFDDRTETICGSIPYMALEMLTELSYTRAVDWWSLGVLIYVMMVGKEPFKGANRREVCRNIFRTGLKFPWLLSSKAESIMKNLMELEVKKRLGCSKKGAEDVKGHPFFRHINWSDLFERKMRPPVQPNISGPEDVSNFYRLFTSLAPDITPPEEKQQLTSDDQEQFKDFDWVAEGVM